jgi:hypothetical protein
MVPRGCVVRTVITQLLVPWYFALLVRLVDRSSLSGALLCWCAETSNKKPCGGNRLVVQRLARRVGRLVDALMCCCTKTAKTKKTFQLMD